MGKVNDFNGTATGTIAETTTDISLGFADTATGLISYPKPQFILMDKESHRNTKIKVVISLSFPSILKNILGEEFLFTNRL